ncbi:hypothetical protein Lser_V15G29943 [Lactuca serriola]
MYDMSYPLRSSNQNESDDQHEKRSSDRNVKFWDLETFELIGTTRAEAKGVRSVAFHPDGRTLFCGLDNSLKVYSWEPIIFHDVIDIGWSTLGDLCIDDGKLLGCSYYQNSIGVWAADVSHSEPYAHNMIAMEKAHVDPKTNLQESVDERERKFLVELFNKKIGKQNAGRAYSAKDIDLGDPFVYKHLGSMASVGRYKALVDLIQSKVVFHVVQNSGPQCNILSNPRNMIDCTINSKELLWWDLIGTLGKTPHFPLSNNSVRGMMYYRRALKLQAFFDMANQQEMLEGYKATSIPSEDEKKSQSSLNA